MANAQRYAGLTLEDGSRLLRVIGEGRFAQVYEARAPTGERVAVKVLVRRDHQATTRFAREIKVMKELPDHPNRVAYRAHGTMPDGGLWLAMELVDGFTLRSVLKAGRRIPPKSACMLMAQLCEGFSGLHTLGMAHRDITPANIMVTHKGRQVKLMDFGLVQDSQGILKLFEQAALVQGDDFGIDLDTGFIAGTPEYMAPEQISDPHEKDRARQRTDTTADVFALGAIFFELLAGRQLFPYAIGSGGVSDRHQAMVNYLDWRTRMTPDDYDPPADLDAELWSILRKSLHPDPDHRQRNAGDLGQDIRFYLETGQGVFEDDLSATIASGVDLSRLMPRGQRVQMNTAAFQTIRKAALDTEPSSPQPAAPPPLGDAGGPADSEAAARGTDAQPPAPHPLQPGALDSSYMWLVAGFGILLVGVLLALALAR